MAAMTKPTPAAVVAGEDAPPRIASCARLESGYEANASAATAGARGRRGLEVIAAATATPTSWSPTAHQVGGTAGAKSVPLRCWWATAPSETTPPSAASASAASAGTSCFF